MKLKQDKRYQKALASAKKEALKRVKKEIKKYDR
jgi:hypothetical protein